MHTWMHANANYRNNSTLSVLYFGLPWHYFPTMLNWTHDITYIKRWQKRVELLENDMLSHKPQTVSGFIVKLPDLDLKSKILFFSKTQNLMPFPIYQNLSQIYNIFHSNQDLRHFGHKYFMKKYYFITKENNKTQT